MYQLNMLIGDCSISESEGFSADLQCVCHLFTFQDTQWDMRVNLSCSYLSPSMLTVHICAIAVKKKITTIVCKREQLQWLSPQKNGGFYPRHPVSLLCALLQLCPGSTGARSCLKNMLQYNLGCSWSSPQTSAAQSHCPLALRDYLLPKNTPQTAAQGACRQALLNNTASLIASLQSRVR